jgi:hypothetical protein
MALFLNDALPPDCFAGLPAVVQRRLLKLMARISEKSYRRGLHHGLCEHAKECGLTEADASYLRHEVSIDRSPWFGYEGMKHSFGRGTSAIERLDMEYGSNLASLGIRPTRLRSRAHKGRGAIHS